MKETSNVRLGEELDEKGLTGFLAREMRLPANEILIRQFPAGSSNLTYLLDVDGNEFVLRRPPFGNRVKTAHDMAREFEVLSKLSKIYPPAPKPLIFCGDEKVIGAEFYLMERKQGLVIRGGVPDELERSESLRRSVCRAFIRNLAELHSLDFRSAGLEDFGKPEGYTQRQVVGWSQRYFNAKTDEWEDLEEAIFWLNNNIPPDDGPALVHNDYKFDNIMLDPDDLTNVTAVLDWEMATIGSPLLDLGTTLGYWMSPESGEDLMSMPFNPKALMETTSRGELAEIYAEMTGADISNIVYFYVFGTVKIAVIAQQIYFRYVRGYTADERFAGFAKFVEALGKIARRTIAEQRL